MTLILFLDVGCYFLMITAVCTNGPSLQNVLLHFNSYSTTTLLKEKFPFTVQYEVSLGMAADTSTA